MSQLQHDIIWEVGRFITQILNENNILEFKHFNTKTGCDILILKNGLSVGGIDINNEGSIRCKLRILNMPLFLSDTYMWTRVLLKTSIHNPSFLLLIKKWVDEIPTQEKT